MRHLSHNMQDKQIRIKNFLEFLIKKHNSSTHIIFSNEPPSYRFEDKIINISLIDLKNETLSELLWTVAHEYRHHLQYMGKVSPEIRTHYVTRLDKLKQCKDSIKKNSYSLLLIPIMIAVLKDYPLLMFLFNLPILTIFLFFVNRPGIDFYIWLSDQKILEFEKSLERDADLFANQEVGTGSLVWGKYQSDPDFSVEKTQHPSHKERFLTALKYKINPQIYEFLD